MKVRLALLAMVALLALAAVLRRGALDQVRKSAEPPPPRNEPPATWEPCRDSLLRLPPSPVVEEEIEENPPDVAPHLYWWNQTLAQVARLQNPDGSWGKDYWLVAGEQVDQTGITGLVLSAFVTQGYTHLSKDEHDGVNFGRVFKTGLKWLVARQNDDGSFPTEGYPDINHVLATLALSETYGATATQLIREPAQKAVEALERRYVRAQDLNPLLTAWLALAISSAREAELQTDEGLAYVTETAVCQSMTQGNRSLAETAVALLRPGRHRSEFESAAYRVMGDPAGVDDRERAYFESILELKGLPLLDENARLSWHESRRAFMKSAMSECTEKQFREQWSDGYVVRSSLYLLNHGVLFRFGY